MPAALMVTVSPSTVTASDDVPEATLPAPSARVTATSAAASQVRSSSSKWVSCASVSSDTAAAVPVDELAALVPATAETPVEAVPAAEQPARPRAAAMAATER
ncbi:hypothetical protein AB0N71_12865 [Pseudarthrobacter enclensis]|uniref:hypothetical protein n=1 Tax=Pseudarthrobacter enclensis TaxID=993070 RepID=UPI00341A09B7